MAAKENTEPVVDIKSSYVGPEGKESAGSHDRVVMASRLPDGSPAHRDDFEFIGPKDGVKEAARHQLVTAAHVALQIATDPGFVPDPEDLEKAIAPAEKKADAEVDAHHKGAFDDNAS